VRARPEGLICQGRAGCPVAEMQVVAGVGQAARHKGRFVGELPDDSFLNAVRSYGSGPDPARGGLPLQPPRVMFSVAARHERRYLICLDHAAPLGAVDAALVRVFAANVAAGFENVNLFENLAARTVDLERFAFAATHDLQEPLRRIAMLADAVATKANGIDETSRERLRSVHASAAHMRKLVGRLLEYVTSREDDFEIVDVPLGALVAEVEERLYDEIKAAGAVIEVGTLPWVRADAASLARVLTILIENAIAYRGVEPLRIRVGAEIEGQDVTLIVADNGDGFDPGRSDDIFDAFRRLHSQSEIPGAGLGLSIAKRIVEHHGGRIRAESGRGRGASFFIRLPRARSALQQEADPRGSAPPDLLVLTKPPAELGQAPALGGPLAALASPIAPVVEDRWDRPRVRAPRR
jgi:signal transduction histidine kinase